MSGRGQTREVHQGGIDIDKLDWRLTSLSGFSEGIHAGCADDERRACRLLVAGMLGPKSVVVAQVPTVVAPDTNDGIGSHRRIGAERGEDSPQLIVRETGRGEVAVDEVAGFAGIRDRVGPDIPISIDLIVAPVKGRVPVGKVRVPV